MSYPDKNKRRVESPFFKPHPVLGEETLDIGEGLHSFNEAVPKWVFPIVMVLGITFFIYEALQILHSLGIVINDYR